MLTAKRCHGIQRAAEKTTCTKQMKTMATPPLQIKRAQMLIIKTQAQTLLGTE